VILTMRAPAGSTLTFGLHDRGGGMVELKNIRKARRTLFERRFSIFGSEADRVMSSWLGRTEGGSYQVASGGGS
jgi:hypothetical protein